MQRALYALAHQGISGHRGRDATMARLEAEVRWDGMRKDVEAWRKLCLQCLKLAEGDVVPRPLASQILAEYPGEVLMADYIKLGASRTGLNYILRNAGGQVHEVRVVRAYGGSDGHRGSEGDLAVGQYVRFAEVVGVRRGLPL